MNLVYAIKETQKELLRIEIERDNQLKNLRFAFETLSKYCNIYANDENVYDILQYPINDEIHILLLNNKVYESKKEVNIIPGLKVINEQINSIIKQYEPDISSLKEGLKTLRTMNDVCETCTGRKMIKKRACAEDDGTMYTCPVCKGTGKSKK